MAAQAESRRNGVPAEVHALLVLWGNYTRRHRDEGPGGLPTQSPFVKAALYGKLGIPQESNVHVEQSDPPLVELIQRIRSGMPEELGEVIDMRYRPPLNEYGHEPPFEMMAKRLAMSASTFRTRLESAQWFVYARMYASN